jgi:hypothetical protein
MDLLKTIGVRLVTSLLVMAVVAGGIAWWRMDDAAQSAILSAAGRILAWAGVVLALPWATFPLIGAVARRAESNAAGALLVGAYTLLEAAGLAWLMNWSIHGAAAWTAFAAAVLVAAIYNLLMCDWIAERTES